MKKILLFVCTCVAFSLGACSSDEQTDTTIELACPKPYVDRLLRREVTIKWPAIGKAAGYACQTVCNDAENDWEFFDGDVLCYTGTKLPNGHYLFRIYAVGDDAHTTDSQMRTIEFDIDYDPVLGKPDPQAVLLNNIASISWAAVPNAAGYAYKIDGAEQWTEVGADVLLVQTDALENGDHTFTVAALGSAATDTVDSESATIDFRVDYTPASDYTKGVFLRVLPVGVTGPAEHDDINVVTGDIYEFVGQDDTQLHTLQLPAVKGLYTVIVDGVEWGWMPFSGNGCVGTVNNENAAIPFRSSPAYYADYYVAESVGRLAAGSAGLALYANLETQGMVTFTIDCGYADGVPRYAVALDATDASVVFSHRFDLMVWGGDWVAGNTIKGNRVPIDNNTPSLNDVDGTEAATNHTASYTNGGAKEDWTVKSALYDRNRHLEGWEGDNVIEHPGYLRINTGGYLKTPRFSALTGPTTVIVEIDVCRFSNVGPNTFAVEGTGTIKSCRYWKDGASEGVDAPVGGDGQRFTITEEMASPYNSGAAKTGPKEWTRLSFEIEGATSDTRIGIVDVVSTSRICIDNVVVRRK